MTRQEEAEDRHQERATEFENLIGVEGVIVYPVGHRSFGIEVSIDTPDGDGIIGQYETEDEDELSEVVNDLKSKLDYLEEQGLDRDMQQYYVAGTLDSVVRVTS